LRSRPAREGRIIDRPDQAAQGPIPGLDIAIIRQLFDQNPDVAVGEIGGDAPDNQRAVAPMWARVS
jgi:hypothetical protein